MFKTLGWWVFSMAYEHYTEHTTQDSAIYIYIYIVGIIHDGNLYWPTQNEMKQENWTLLNWPTRPPLSMDNSFYRLFHRGEKWGRHFPWIYSDDMFPRGPSRRSIWCPSRAIGSPEDQRITAMISSEKEVVPVTGRKKGRKNWASCCWWSLEISQVAGKSMEVLMGKSYIYIYKSSINL